MAPFRPDGTGGGLPSFAGKGLEQIPGSGGGRIVSCVVPDVPWNLEKCPMPASSRPYDIFITHAWRYHDDWTRMGEQLNADSSFRWRNFSVPWYDPAMDPNTPVGSKFVNSWLESQIIPVDIVIFLESVYAVKSARKWLDMEIEIARAHKKPILAVPAFGSTVVGSEVSALSDAVCFWDTAMLIMEIKNMAVPVVQLASAQG